MRKALTLIIAMLFCGTLLNAALPPELEKNSNPDLYERLRPAAERNLQKLPKPARKGYADLLDRYDDILMSYLIAYEQDAKLAEAVPEYIEQNYLEIVRLIEQEGMGYSAEFFLSYIARQSVSDERLEPYRKAMLKDGLQEVLKFKDPLTRFRETANWCVEKLKFVQTSGRDQSPLDICSRSLAGRCEEMQILFVAAARTVGIPSRPASTPWWAHMDNNHAWAEVYLDGRWQYTGDMDAAYFPNQTWFSGMIDKTVMILAEGSLAAEDDEVLISGAYETIINSTPNYAKDRSRRVEVLCLDSDGTPLPDVPVSIMVYNWGALRPIITLKSDSSGRLGFSSGSGDFYLSAFKDGKSALSLVKASAAKTIVVELQLNRQALSALNEVLEYPANDMDWKQAPPEYVEEVAQRKELWLKTINTWEENAAKSPIPDSVATLCRGNLPQLEEFWQKHEPVHEDYQNFLTNCDPKFLWQADARQFEAHYRFWLKQDKDLPFELLSPTVYYEELPQPYLQNGKAKLYPAKFIKKAKTPGDQMRKALKWQKRKYRIKPEKALTGIPRMDVMADQLYLSPLQYRLLSIYILRANGIPAEFTRLPDNILVYLDEDWHYYDLAKEHFTEQNNADGTSRQISIRLIDERGIPVSSAADRFTLTRYVEGNFYDINGEVSENGAGNYSLELTDPDIQLFFGYRISDSKTALQMIPILAATDTLEITAPQYPRTWEHAPEDFIILLEDTVSEDVNLVILGNHDQENSLRVAQKLLDLDLEFNFIGYTQQGSHRVPNYIFSPTWQSYVREDETLKLRTITLYKDAEGWKMYDGLWDKLPR
jgi:transglutaminase-like putative cysteine protease